MKSLKDIRPEFLAFIAAILFGASNPIAKLLLEQIDPIFLAGFLYLGSGIGLLLTKYIFGALRNKEKTEAQLEISDLPRVIAAMLTGGVVAPIILMLGLRHTQAATASLLLNFETISTALIAGLIFKEAIGRKVWIAVICITIAGIILTVDVDSKLGISIGALGVLAACIFWGIDNNITNTISAKDPLSIVTIKALGAGTFSILLGFMLHKPLPNLFISVLAMIVGYFSYGVSIVLFILAMRGMGAARAGTLFGTAPFVGAFLSFLIFKSMPDLRFLGALPFMIAGTILLLGDSHSHEHMHFGLHHDHRHTHDDEHHNHDHETSQPDQPHTHLHSHINMRHQHLHAPDIHHRHEHN